MKIEWPLWWCLEPAAQVLLMELQWNLYGYHIQIPPMPDHTRIDTEIESPEEIDWLMKQPPKHQKRAV